MPTPNNYSSNHRHLERFLSARKTVIFLSGLLFILTFFLHAVEFHELEKQLPNSRGKKRISILTGISESLLKENPRKAISYGNEALTLLKQYPDRIAEIKVLDQMCQAFLRLGDYDHALPYGEKSLEVAQKIGNRKTQSVALNILSIIYNRKGDFFKSRDYLHKALTIFRELNEKKGIATVLNNIGISYDMQGNYPKALEYYQKSLQIKEELGDNTIIASSINNIGVIYQVMGNHKKALENYFRALDIRVKMNDPRNIASLYNNIANVYWDLKERQKALEYYEKSLEIDRKLNNNSGIAGSLYNIGYVYKELNDYKKALDFYKQALVIQEKMGENRSISQTLIEIGSTYNGMFRYSDALQSINRGLTIARSTDSMDLIMQGCQAISDTHEKTGDYKSALKYYKEYKETEAKILDNESKKKITEIQAKYEDDKKEKEITILKKDNEIQKYQINRQTMIRNLLIAAFVLLIIFGLYYARKYQYVFAFWKKKNYIGHYKILQQVASGGMGTVFKAQDFTDSSQRTIAIKVLREEFFADEVHKKRFKQEAAMIDQVVHPNIVKVIERGESEGNLYLAMELLEGPTLTKIIQQEKQLQISTTVHIMLQIADAIKSIHALNIIHRDLKPENIILTQTEQDPYFVKLLDFGLATTQYMDRLTQTGIVIGSLAYLSPEQVTGKQITLSSDIHALGVIYYEMLTGTRPFIGETTIDIMKQILNKEPIPPNQLRPEIDRMLNDLIMFMLKKNPEQRPRIASIFGLLKELSNHI